jgi:hypothetical protein
LKLLQETIQGEGEGSEKIGVRLRAIKILLAIDQLNARREAIQVSREPKVISNFKDLPTPDLLAKLQETLQSMGLPSGTLNTLLGEDQPPMLPMIEQEGGQ